MKTTSCHQALQRYLRFGIDHDDAVQIPVGGIGRSRSTATATPRVRPACLAASGGIRKIEKHGNRDPHLLHADFHIPLRHPDRQRWKLCNHNPHHSGSHPPADALTASVNKRNVQHDNRIIPPAANIDATL